MEIELTSQQDNPTNVSESDSLGENQPIPKSEQQAWHRSKKFENILLNKYDKKPAKLTVLYSMAGIVIGILLTSTIINILDSKRKY